MREECVNMQAGTVAQKQWETSNGQGKNQNSKKKKKEQREQAVTS